MNTEIVYPRREIAEAKVTGYPAFVTLAALKAAGISETTVKHATEITKAYAARKINK